MFSFLCSKSKNYLAPKDIPLKIMEDRSFTRIKLMTPIIHSVIMEFCYAPPVKIMEWESIHRVIKIIVQHKPETNIKDQERRRAPTRTINAFVRLAENVLQGDPGRSAEEINASMEEHGEYGLPFCTALSFDILRANTKMIQRELAEIRKMDSKNLIQMEDRRRKLEAFRVKQIHAKTMEPQIIYHRNRIIS